MSRPIPKALTYSDYTVACICPMGVELAPVEAVLDRIHPALPASRDQNAYTLGEIGGHNIVISILPRIGTNATATAATQLLNDFPSIRFTLLVGIGGGVPGCNGEHDVRLGDVVVSQPTDSFPGVVQYDLGKRLGDGTFKRTGYLNKPPSMLSAAVRKLQSQHTRAGSQILQYLTEMLQRNPRMCSQYSFPKTEQDRLFLASYGHPPDSFCDQHDLQQVVPRTPRDSKEPVIHYGTIGSANIVVKDSAIRDELRRDTNVLCLEMEAAGLMDDFACIVIRGICDYADSHKNKRWQPYAAAVAAAYMKELLLSIPVQQVLEARHIEAQITSISQQAESLSRTESYGLCLDEAPYLDPKLFVGRDSDLVAMAQALELGSEPAEHRRLVLGGIGGIGKTQLSIAYAQHYHKQYSSIFWLNATSEATLNTSLQSIVGRIFGTQSSKEFAVEAMLEQFKRWSADARNTQWLLIFDNYDEPEAYDIERYTPFTKHGSIIITTRLPSSVSGEPMLLPPLENAEDGVRILETRSRRNNIKSDPDAYRLAERMKGFPLALATAGVYLQKSTLSFAQYLLEYERRWNLNPRRPLKLQEYRDRTLFTTWDLSFTRLKKDDNIAAQMLKLLAYFGNQGIRYEYLSAGITENSPQWLRENMANTTDFDNIMAVLVEYCFVEAQETIQSYNIHNCVHDWILASLNQVVVQDSYQYALGCVARSIDSVDWHSLGWIQYSHLVPHAVRLTHIRFTEANLLVTTDHESSDALSLASLLEQQGQLDAAAIVHALILADKERVFGPENTTTLDAVHNLGNVYMKQDRLVEAEQMYTRALTGYEKAYGPDHTETLSTVNNLGNVYKKQDRLEEAEQMYMRALTGYEKAYGPDHTETLDTVNNLGIVYRKQDRLEEAEQMYTRALTRYEKAYGPDHTETLDTVNNLGIVYWEQDRLEEAEQMYTRVLTGYEKAYGPDHTATLDTVNNLGIVYRKQDRLEEAEKMYTRALAGYVKQFGSQHKSSIRVVRNLDKLYRRQGKGAEMDQVCDRFGISRSALQEPELLR